MKLFTKAIEKQLQAQFPLGAELENQKVICKIFNPYGSGTWYIMNQDPKDPDYLWGICLIEEAECGSVQKSELEKFRLKPYNFGLERDSFFEPKPAIEIWNALREGQHV